MKLKLLDTGSKLCWNDACCCRSTSDTDFRKARALYTHIYFSLFAGLVRGWCCSFAWRGQNIVISEFFYEFIFSFYCPSLVLYWELVLFLAILRWVRPNGSWSRISHNLAVTAASCLVIVALMIRLRDSSANLVVKLCYFHIRLGDHHLFGGIFGSSGGQSSRI